MSRIRQLLRGLAALAATAVLTAGIPAGLIRYAGWPLPTRIPTLDEIQLALRSGIDPQLLVKTLAVIVWVAWAQLVVALAYEVVAAVRGRVARRAPVMPAIQASAARLVAAITLAAATLAPLRPDAALAHLHPAVTVQADSTHPRSIVQPTFQPAEAPKITEEETGAQPAYRVQRFDTLWGIAETTLGDGRRWQEIRDLNLGRPTSTGKTITTATDHVPAGTRLLLPTDATLDTDRAHDTDEQETEVTVERGDHFWNIAEETLTEAWVHRPTIAEVAAYWHRLIDLNRDRLAPPHDPNLIYPGHVFRLPPIPEPQSDAPIRSSEDASHLQSDEIMVEPGDHFWKIAEETLRDAWGRHPTTAETTAYWQRLIDANRHQLAPPHDPNLIYPGQVFQLPAIPLDPTVPAQAPDGQEERPPATSSTDRQQEAEPEPAIEPDTGSPQTTAPMSEPTAPPTATEPPHAETPGETIIPAADDSDQGADPDLDERSLLPTAARVAGLGLLAAGIIALLNRLRRLQVRQRRPDTVPTPAPATTAPVEATLRAAVAPTASELIDLALRALAHQITDTHLPPPQVVGVHLDHDTLRILLWSPHHQPPEGWRVDDEGRSWALPARIDPTPLRLYADTTPAPYPTMVSVGHTEGGQLLLDLEFAGAVQVTGSPEEVAATCHTMALELASSPFADTLQVVCIGFGHDLAHLERITAVDQLGDALPQVEEKTRLLASETTTPMEGRLAVWGGDRWDPLVIIDPSPSPPEGASTLLAAAHRGRAVAAVVGYPTGDRWRLHVTEGTVHVDPLGLTLSRRNLTTDEQAGIAELLAAAKDLDGTPPPRPQPLVEEEVVGEPIPADIEAEEAEPAETAAPVGAQALPLSDEEAEPALEVKVLGAVRLDGFDGRFSHNKCLELVTYLALHPRGADRDTLLEALWPDQSPSRKRINTIISRTRTSLGTDPRGELYLPNLASDNHHRLAPNIGCDLDRFTHLAKQANKASTDEEAARHLQAALQLVEGPPFHGAGNDYAWAHTEGIATHAIVAIDNAAHRLAQHALEADNPELATWASRQGLVATWACEECYRNLMRAAIHQEDPTALDAIYNELTTLLDADQGPDANSLLDPDTVELYERHRRPRRRHAG